MKFSCRCVGISLNISTDWNGLLMLRKKIYTHMGWRKQRSICIVRGHAMNTESPRVVFLVT